MGLSRKTHLEPLYTTLALLKQYGACESGYRKLVKSLTPAERKQPNRQISLVRVLESNGIDDALWCLRAVPEHQTERRDRLARLYACDCAERALPKYEAKYPNDNRPRKAIKVVRRFADGKATTEELRAARYAAGAAWDAAWAAARDAAGAAWDAAWAAARDAAGAAEREWQADHFREIFG